MWLPCDCAEELQQRSVVYGGEESCSCNGGHGGSSAFEDSGACGCSGGREGSRGLGRRGGSSGKGHRRGSRTGGRGKDGVQGRKGRNSISGKGGGRGSGNNEGDSDVGDEGGIGGDEGGKGGGGGSAIVGKSGLLQNIHSWWGQLYDYCGPVGLWNLALATLLLGYYGKSRYWDTMRGRGISGGGGGGGGSRGRQVGGKIKCAPKGRPPSCCCSCAERPRILKHRLKWPEEDGPCRCRI